MRVRRSLCDWRMRQSSEVTEDARLITAPGRCECSAVEVDSTIFLDRRSRSHRGDHRVAARLGRWILLTASREIDR
jgi:hypothetical protein